MVNITDAEMEIMRIVWDSGERVTTKDIMEKLPGKKTTTILTLAGRLINKGVLKSVKLGRSHAHEYWAGISEEEYQKMQTRNFIRSIHNGSTKSLISALFQDENLTKEDIEELRAFMEKQVKSDD
ncbi:BlaI/MecI/CopY family transcriptional regulator [Pelotomaculum terephthalicicum JT]|uniref:BlaI/MecI/CopY family transcriptional regulator n=1 Tax=Pelotomaculum TaxID=191373 RepID=UPI0009C77081|nr:MULTISPECIES: BlaI/MecI/CopY family transcriptional regulator [Pelotomaculum]MCG9969474.1 BlaI/MecI/CopY family transcriptional regulator [Pelotomaculum terephthalicicum JT]OPX88208.1 MAG: Penicillinase repressor [Pelotomaculum sp. PtaB.Bin117]OPY60921.1 MAG: Penicillinase repressor [Pelotomaculum sp. PtaU1.Bin065]